MKTYYAKHLVVEPKGMSGLPARGAEPKRRRKKKYGTTDLHIAQILEWADAFHEGTGRWPTNRSGEIPGSEGETWHSVAAALRSGGRGLEAGTTLPQLLAALRGLRNPRNLPPYKISTILSWADAHHQRTGSWPIAYSGPIADAPGETWTAVEMALRSGTRGFPGGYSLARLLADRRGVPNRMALDRFTEKQILLWADRHHRRTGAWPTLISGQVIDSPGVTWRAVDSALRDGVRGLAGGSSLPRLLARHRGVRNISSLPRLTISGILAWADAQYRRTRCWPRESSGPILEAPGETWKLINSALVKGARGLPGGTSVARLLAKKRGVPLFTVSPDLTIDTILAWADEHHRRTGDWPRFESGKVLGQPRETWSGVSRALGKGKRGLPSRSSLARLLAEHRGVRSQPYPPPLTEEEILDWADRHRRRTGSWPSVKTGAIVDAPGESWNGVDRALHAGKRGLPGGSSIALLLQEHRGKRNVQNLPQLTIPKILSWADPHHQRTGRWPNAQSGPIAEAPGETWSAVQAALVIGNRGFPGGSSLAAVLRICRGARNR